jgi:hypothetical protein
MDKKLTDKDILLILYNYMKLTKPNVKADISFESDKDDAHIFISLALSEYMVIYCTYGEFILVVADGVREIPSWILDMFHLTRIDRLQLSNRIPISRLYDYYVIEVKDKGLFKTED